MIILCKEILDHAAFCMFSVLFYVIFKCCRLNKNYVKFKKKQKQANDTSQDQLNIWICRVLGIGAVIDA